MSLKNSPTNTPAGCQRSQDCASAFAGESLHQNNIALARRWKNADDMKWKAIRLSMNKYTGLCVGLSIGCLLPATAHSQQGGLGSAAVDGNQATVETNLHVAEFGVVEGKSITNGFVFVDGRYLDAPYRVDRRGLGIFVNGELIDKIYWTGEQQPAGDVDPPVPPGITSTTSIYDPALTDFLRTKMIFLHKHYKREQAVKMLFDVYKSLPCFKSVEFVEGQDSTIRVTMFDGETSNIGLVPLTRTADMTKSGVLKRANAKRENYEVRLGMGDYFMFLRGGQITGGAGGSAELLPKLVAILRSGTDDATKFEEIQQTHLIEVRPDSFAAVVTNFFASTQLEERLKVLLKQVAKPDN